MNPLKQLTSEVEALEWLALGIALASKTERKGIRPSMFTHSDFADSIQSLLDGRGYGPLEKLLLQAGVEWSSDNGTPVRSIVDALERDGRYSRTLDAVNAIIKDTCDDGWKYRKEQFCDRMERLSDAVKHAAWVADNKAEAINAAQINPNTG